MAPDCWFLVLVCWLPLLLAGAEEQQGRGDDGCSPKMCGSVNISSPFWLTYWDEPQAPCGSSDFEVTCDKNTTPILRNAVSFDQAFAIKDISYKESSLRVVDLYAQNVSEVCLGRNWNFSVKVDRPFKISPSNLNLALYNCTTAAMAQARRDPALVEMGACGSKGSMFVRGAGGRYDANRSYAGYYREGCNATIVPVLGTSDHEANPSDYKQLISYGFLLTWDLHPRPLPVVPGNNTVFFCHDRGASGVMAVVRGGTIHGAGAAQAGDGHAGEAVSLVGIDCLEGRARHAGWWCIGDGAVNLAEQER